MDSSLNSNPIFYVIALFDEKEKNWTNLKHLFDDKEKDWTKQQRLFDDKYKNWTTLEHLFDTEQDALNFINFYPRFGHPHSRAIREGNWQIVKYIN
jgi:hypothetical protein